MCAPRSLVVLDLHAAVLRPALRVVLGLGAVRGDRVGVPEPLGLDLEGGVGLSQNLGDGLCSLLGQVLVVVGSPLGV